MNADLAGVALAAGAGTRLRPLTTLRPKALCPIDGVPLLDLALARLAPHTGDGPAHVAVNAHHLAEQVVAAVGDRAHLSLERPVALGTAGALGRLRGWLDGRHVLVTNADAYLPDGVGHLVRGWDGERCRLLTARVEPPGDFDAAGTAVRYVGACLLPWDRVADLDAEPTGLYEVLWREEARRGRLEFVTHAGTAIDCGTPTQYLRANLRASGGASVVGAGATVEGSIERCVVWPGAHVHRDEHLVDCIRAGTRDRSMTVPAGAGA